MGNKIYSTSTASTSGTTDHLNAGNTTGNSRGSKVLFFLQQTWITVTVTAEKWTKIRVGSSSSSGDVLPGVGTPGDSSYLSNPHGDYFENESLCCSSQFSQYSFCSCEQCQRDDGFSSGCDSDLFGDSMAPNSDESTRIGQFSPYNSDDSLTKQEKQRPPIYNPEDYALSLKKWGRKPTNGSCATPSSSSNNHNGSTVNLYPIITPINNNNNAPSSDSDRLINLNNHHHHNGNTGGASSFRDYRSPMMMMGSVSGLGGEMTLRQFGTVSELLTKLKSDLRLAYPSFVQEFIADPLDGVTLLLDLLRAIQLSQSQSTKTPPPIQRRALLDELSCLQCLLHCCQRYPESIRRLTASSAGLFTLAICIMSNVTKCRVLALDLLTKACLTQGSQGHSAVSEAISTLRLRFGEPVRFRFLVGMLMSSSGSSQGELLASGLRFLNTFLDTSGSMQNRLYVQAELEQAGFDVASVKKNISINSPSTERIFEELDNWEKKHIDVETLLLRVETTESENDSLRDKVLLLERRVQILLEEKGILMSLEQCLKERCSELQQEVTSLKSLSGSSKNNNEDEGISERSLTPEDPQRESSVAYELYQSDKKQDDEDEEETTIDEVIEELRNIINDAETEQYNKKQELEKKQIEDAHIANKIQMKVIGTTRDSEGEIVPKLNPQPPRRSKSLMHLFIPSEDYDDDIDHKNKELFFENETPYTSEDSSDSLLSASKYHNGLVKATEEPTKTTDKSKSLDRLLDSGLNSMIDVVVTNNKTTTYFGGCGSSDTTVKLLRNNLYECNSPNRMFLPSKRDHGDVPYYFPRIQEKKASNFLIKRGHGNAGMYSGTTSTGGNVNLAVVTRKNDSISSSMGKVTDLPSGLY